MSGSIESFGGMMIGSRRIWRNVCSDLCDAHSAEAIEVVGRIELLRIVLHFLTMQECWSRLRRSERSLRDAQPTESRQCRGVDEGVFGLKTRCGLVEPSGSLRPIIGVRDIPNKLEQSHSLIRISRKIRVLSMDDLIRKELLLMKITALIGLNLG